MNRKIYALPVLIALCVLIGTQMFAPAQPQAQAPAWDVTTVDLPFTPVVQAEVDAEPGPGYRPASDSKCDCANCNCDELEKRVTALETKVAAYGTARTTVSSGSVGSQSSNNSAGVTASRVATPLPYGSVLVSERVVGNSRSPQVFRQSQATYRTPVRNVVRGVANGTCRIVNGVRVCN